MIFLKLEKKQIGNIINTLSGNKLTNFAIDDVVGLNFVTLLHNFSSDLADAAHVGEHNFVDGS